MLKTEKTVPHQPVLLDKVLQALNVHSKGFYIDCTFGRGGHTKAILKHLGSEGRVLALDQDPEAVLSALQSTDERFSIVHSDFAQLSEYVQKQGWMGKVKGILLDLGVSSPQIDTPNRGFSFIHEGPLDMRMNPNSTETVAQWLSKATADEIAIVLKNYGEERHARRISRSIVIAREQGELKTTLQLAQIVATAQPPPRPGVRLKHPATRTFQALRIFINQELDQLQKILPQVLDILAPGGRLVVISFHSLEDRIVKRFIRDCVRGDDFPKGLPITVDALNVTLRSMGKPIRPNEAEIEENPRARSAIMRVAERI
ncbi:MAG: 16S rRNA (cytosine(1402)-N(4))-methyltransferase RsmH [Thiomargarita sp.]|nr:16S rRNA (cytosine(1402)-N(4))-methyltransferase RsmH [Thiomargarita sp.]